MTVVLALPFEDSRRLTGCNLFFASTGAVLEVAGVAVDDCLLGGWRERVDRARARLGWGGAPSLGQSSAARPSSEDTVARIHAGGASLAMAAPCDQLFTATEVNEWALSAALYERDPFHWSALLDALRAAALEAEGNPFAAVPPVLEESAALARFEHLAAIEAKPALRELVAVAAVQGLASVLDDSELTLGLGARGTTHPLDGLPAVEAVPWSALGNVPTALVTGSNGKTTTVRLIAACARAHGWHAGYNCTDGVYSGADVVATGDYAGPVGARQVLRDARTQAAVLETARGGVLRRGIAVTRADVAVVTNVSSDHFGEYGIHDLDGLADVKLSVAGVLPAEGLLVLNADDLRLRSRAPGLAQRFGRTPRIGWFALDADAPLLVAHRNRDGATCGVRDGRMCLGHGGVDHDLGAVGDMPIAVDGHAAYNVANLAAAALAAAGLGVPPALIAEVFTGFGARAADNVGRLMRFERGGAVVLVDYAHNPEGVRGLLGVARHLRRDGGRIGMTIGHAGNRLDADIADVARVAAGFTPDLVVIAENEKYLRGRAPGEVPAIIRGELLRQGLPEASLPVCASEIEAVHRALAWARPGDVLALLVHSSAARDETIALLTAAARPG